MQKGEHVCSYLALFAIISDKRFQHHTTSARQYQPPVLGLHGGSNLEPRVMSIMRCTGYLAHPFTKFAFPKQCHLCTRRSFCPFIGSKIDFAVPFLFSDWSSAPDTKSRQAAPDLPTVQQCS